MPYKKGDCIILQRSFITDIGITSQAQCHKRCNYTSPNLAAVTAQAVILQKMVDAECTRGDGYDCMPGIKSSFVPLYWLGQGNENSTETGTTLRACMHFNQRMFQAFKFSFICYMYGNTTLLQQAPLNLFSVELTADTSHVVD